MTLKSRIKQLENAMATLGEAVRVNVIMRPGETLAEAASRTKREHGIAADRQVLVGIVVPMKGAADSGERKDSMAEGRVT